MLVWMTAPGEHSWPIVAWASFLLHAEQSNCNKLRGLVEFVYWTQTSETADVDLSRYDLSLTRLDLKLKLIYPSTSPHWLLGLLLCNRTYGVSANQIEATKTYVFTQLEALKCDGEFVVPFQHCLINGTLCSNEGLCSDELGTCICESGHSGVHCETIITSSSADNLAIGLGTCVCVCVCGGAWLLTRAVQEWDCRWGFWCCWCCYCWRWW
jgi:hypothetical protein